MLKTYPVTPILHIKQAAMTSHTLVIITASARVCEGGAYLHQHAHVGGECTMRPLTALDSNSICMSN